MTEETMHDWSGKAKVFDVPSIISVETRFITHLQQAEQTITHTFDTTTMAVHPALSANSPSEAPTSMSSSPTEAGAPKPETVEMSVQTDGRNPTRDRGQQCLNSSFKGVSIGIQCSLDDEILEFYDDEKEPTQKKSKDEASFRRYVEENSAPGFNDKYECLWCGEILKSQVNTDKHMLLHYGPPALCYKCGTIVSHEALLKDHKCPLRFVKKARKILASQIDLNFKCPQFDCPVIAVSRQELYDHINEHNNFSPYRCEGCITCFPTYGELRLHKRLHKKCAHVPMTTVPYDLPKQEMIYKKRVALIRHPNGMKVLVKKFLSHAMDLKKCKRPTFNMPRYCHICLQRCSSVFRLKNHMKRCSERHRERIEEKQNPLVRNLVPNGVKH